VRGVDKAKAELEDTASFAAHLVIHVLQQIVTTASAGSMTCKERQRVVGNKGLRSPYLWVLQHANTGSNLLRNLQV
jgi:hypothetical protein